MVEAGLACVSLAIEHGDDYIRNKVIGKGLDRKRIFEVAKLFKKYKFLFHTSGFRFIRSFDNI